MMYATQAPSLHRFHAYTLAVGFRRIVVRWLPLRRTELSDQLDRASISVPLNVAAGSGRSTPRERARHYTIARGSAVECLACLDLLELELSSPSTAEARAILIRLLDVLTALIRR
jgi:four helix bundle protein